MQKKARDFILDFFFYFVTKIFAYPIYYKAYNNNTIKIRSC